ncbi:ATP-binding protein [Haliscomenobacter sp.]|uniref:ATP-binding protein n=1 Tax=Haliscomenobacter sp. TaxID=2717303 RepID=UPI003BA9589A
MRNLIFYLVLFPLLAFAQKREAFRIDSLPKKGVLLNEGWKLHLGDNPNWAKVEFDDLDWEKIDPTKDIFDLSQIPKTGEIVWLRLHLELSDTTTQQLLFTLRQSGASEWFFNGRKIYHFGTLSENRNHILAISPVFRAEPFPIKPGRSAVLAVRFAIQPNIRYPHVLLANTNPLIYPTLYRSRDYIEQYNFINLTNVKHSNIFRIGAFLLLFISYMAQYIYYPQQKASLYFALFSLSDILFNLSMNYIILNQFVWMYYWANTFMVSIQQIGTICLLTGLYRLLDQKSSWYFWGCVFLVFVGIGINFFLYNSGFVTILVFGNILNLEIVRISLKAIKTQKPGAWIISFGGMSFLVFWIIFYLLVTAFQNIGYHTIGGSIYNYADIFYNLALLSVPVAVSIYSGLEIALTSRSLKEKLIEVEQLSTEKQQILRDQNQTLERQVAERTTELTQKNRELEIEAALERVRARALAMQRSNEVLDVAATLYGELQKLDFTFGIIGINLIDAQTGDTESWVAGFGQDTYPQSYRIPHFEHPFQKSFMEAWRNGSSYLVYQLAGTEKKDYDDFMFTQSGYKAIPDDVKARMIATEQVTFSLAFMKHGTLLWAPTPLTEEKAQVFQRFAKVFEQAYTRFLDLQKAEAQAEQASLNLIQIQTEKKRAEDALIALKLAQSQLIQSEKLASLGELTAGIAHEIQNPLNFVNNFAEVSAEMIDELKEELEKGDLAEVKAIAEDLQVNLGKINHHGGRASSIVKGMLEHSRTSSGVKEPTNLNTLADEFLRLAYHGLRAKDSSFNCKMETYFEPDLPVVSVISQDIGRVLLNLINNAFYAVQQRTVETLHATSLQHPPYHPTVTVSTQKTDNQIIIKVMDNGNGIPEAIRDKIFQPFFTTKPTGQGTGLGLSLAYDIVTKGHGGTLKIESTEGIGTEFSIILPVKVQS